MERRGKGMARRNAQEMASQSEMLQALALGAMLADKSLRADVSPLAFGSNIDMLQLARVLKGDKDVPMNVLRNILDDVFGVQWDGQQDLLDACFKTLAVNEAYERFVRQKGKWLENGMTTEDKSRVLATFASLQEKKQDGAAWVDVLKSVLGGNK